MELKNERNVDDDLEDMGMEKNELFDFVHWQRKEKEISWMVQKQAAMEGHTDSRPNTTNSWTVKPDKGHAPDISKTHVISSLLGLVQDLYHNPSIGPAQ
ncbi:hypothetical protein Tco_0209137 [Tanacetum coccineum]